MCEYFHSRYNFLFKTPHPNINAFLEVKKKIQFDTIIFILTFINKPKQIKFIEKNIT